MEIRRSRKRIYGHDPATLAPGTVFADARDDKNGFLWLRTDDAVDEAVAVSIGDGSIATDWDGFADVRIVECVLHAES